MKLVFTQNGMDRSGEIDEWIALIHEEKSPKKSQKSAEEEPREEKDLEFVLPEKPVAARQELRPAKKPSKDHEKQPPVKRLLSLYKVPEEEREEERPPEPVKRTPLRQVAEPIQKPEESAGQEHGLPAREPEGQKVKKPEVQSAMKVAMKGAMHTVRQPVIVPVRRPSEPIRRSIVEREPDGERIPEHRPVVVEKTHEPSRVIAPERGLRNVSMNGFLRNQNLKRRVKNPSSVTTVAKNYHTRPTSVRDVVQNSAPRGPSNRHWRVGQSRRRKK